MKALKIISVISFLLIGGIQLHGTVNFALLFLYLVDFIQSFTYNNLGIYWEISILAIFTIGTLIIYLLCRKGKDRFLLLFCFVALLLSVLFLTGAFDQNNYDRISFGFIIPLLIFYNKFTNSNNKRFQKTIKPLKQALTTNGQGFFIPYKLLLIFSHSLKHI
ncbi:hypothetical protein SAMN05421796_10173 [Chryseobacterium piscicola]|jgi:peptidoglycan/LPS O-acetylase OafA/YrhL|uniref:Uncharacterized protein n=2 Tax=Chryseobacterium TaxID=59732 RepID=A0A1N7JPU3_9FLAO|nr:hypothetical protein [Chryseobacterium piscicola]PQA91338.1 hypothetical protein B0A70_12770 [Chryseobacterium piscicola]SIS51383.1 hypothetical protein SAMN05421796_10173 [Chryseobacterium piscicola]